MGIFGGNKQVVEIYKTDRELRCGKFELSITENGYLIYETKYTLFKFYLKHIDTVSYFTNSKDDTDYISIQIIGQGVLLGTISFEMFDDFKNVVQEWLIERIEEAKQSR